MLKIAFVYEIYRINYHILGYSPRTIRHSGKNLGVLGAITFYKLKRKVYFRRQFIIGKNFLQLIGTEIKDDHF